MDSSVHIMVVFICNIAAYLVQLLELFINIFDISGPLLLKVVVFALETGKLPFFLASNVRKGE